MTDGETRSPHPLSSAPLQVASGVATAPVLVGFVSQVASGGSAAFPLGIAAAVCMAFAATSARLTPVGAGGRHATRSTLSGAAGAALVLAGALAWDSACGAGVGEAVAAGAAGCLCVALVYLASLCGTPLPKGHDRRFLNAGG